MFNTYLFSRDQWEDIIQNSIICNVLYCRSYYVNQQFKVHLFPYVVTTLKCSLEKSCIYMFLVDLYFLILFILINLLLL